MDVEEMLELSSVAMEAQVVKCTIELPMTGMESFGIEQTEK